MKELLARVAGVFFMVFGAVTLGDGIWSGLRGKEPISMNARALMALFVILAMYVRFTWDSRRKCDKCDHHPNAHKSPEGCRAILVEGDEYKVCGCGSEVKEVGNERA